MKHERTSIPRLTCVDAYCGAGGLSLGLTRAGFECATAFDLNEPAVETYKRNVDRRAFVADVRKVDASFIRGKAGLREGLEVDLLAGGPPCQGFSKQKRGAHLGDPRNLLVVEFFRLIRELRPRAFMLENVSQLAQIRGRTLVRDAVQQLQGYRLTPNFYVAADYGVAQTRERFVLVGIRKDVPGEFKIPRPTSPKWRTVRDQIGDLPEPPSDYSEHSLFPNHRATRITRANIERFSFVPQGGGWRDIPFEYRLPCHQKVDVSRGGWPDVYGRLEWEGQCPTITGGFDSFTRGRYGHPEQNRAITPREAARLQGFPDDFVFYGNRDDVRHQIGNAVPVPLAEAIGIAIYEALSGEATAVGSLPELELSQRRVVAATDAD